MTEARTRPDDSAFRSWFRDCLREIPGNNVEWPSLVRLIFAEELKRLRDSDQYYDGQVFKNRDREVAEHRHRDSDDEEVLVYRLYAAVHDNYHGVLHIGDMPVWLFSCEVPNQGKELSNRTKKRRADLLGLRQDGSLVVFECKGPQNRHDSPLYGLLEGLDYLGCLLTRRNLASLSDDLQDWLGNTASQEQQFSSVFPEDWTLEIEPQACHGVVVLAPKSYYDLHLVDATMQPEDWWLLSERRSLLSCHEPGVFLDFAVVDYGQGTAEWFIPPAFQVNTEVCPILADTPLDSKLPLSRDLIWNSGSEEIQVTKVRQGDKNVRIRLPDQSTRLVPIAELRPMPQP